jgi:hypothetical protein
VGASGGDAQEWKLFLSLHPLQHTQHQTENAALNFGISVPQTSTSQLDKKHLDKPQWMGNSPSGKTRTALGLKFQIPRLTQTNIDYNSKTVI